jgi:exodeoxyribonuclease V beta subunit
MMVAYDPAEPIGPGRMVIEAGAGTGKTFTIAAVVARLVAAEEIPIERIMVMTFTRAATAELRGRVRDRLVDTLAAVGSGYEGDDPHLLALLEAAPPEAVVERVGAALAGFDRAQIFTIHGFAQRLLVALGFVSRLPADLEPVALDARLVAESAADLVVGRWAVAGDGRDRLTPAEVAAIGWEVATKLDATIVPDLDRSAGRARARVEMAHTIRGELERRLRRAGQVTFDDGLRELAAVLHDPETATAARRLLSTRYQIGLVDEAQDTDPTQWEVIGSVFERLVVIGDPKQSIYRFRGADVGSYLHAAEHARPRTLSINRRSDQRLLDALDALFGGVTFGDEAIAYHVLKAPEGRPYARIEGVAAALSIRWLSPELDIPRRDSDPDMLLVGPARSLVAADAAAGIVDLLESGVCIEGEALRPSDIAVLCRTARQVDLVRAELDRRRVPSVAGRSGAVFASTAAEEWRRFLMAVEHPERIDLVRLGVTSLLVGRDLEEVAGADDEADVNEQVRMRSLQRILHDQGVPALFTAVDRETHLTERVLGRQDGERTMTDLTHVAEELHAAWRPGRMGSLVTWLEGAMRESRQREADRTEEPEARQRRLETDAEAVQVLTVHAAKGLEFPVVLVPFAWDVWRKEPDIPVLHDATGRRRLIDVAGTDGWEGFAANAAAAVAEEIGEESRLLYVALTRARHHLVVWWAKQAPGAPASSLGRLLARPEWKEAARRAAADVVDKPIVSALPEVRRYGGTHRSQATLTAAVFGRPLDHDWRRASFSSLSPEHPLADETAELKADDETPAESEPASDLPMADLPRGARFGTLVHEVLEGVSFDDPDLEGAIRRVVAERMGGSAWEFDPEVLVAGLVAAMTTPLGPDPSAPTLAGSSRVLKELVFELPVRTGAGPVSLADVAEVMAAHLPTGDPFRAYTGRLGPDQRFRGFLTGAIDLTLTLPDGRFVVMDYKTNALPDYGGGGLATAMVEGNYVLQSTLYQVALHRYLGWRLPGYEPARHLGGSIYLFLRGAGGPSTPVLDGVRQGVHVWTPPPEMIVALSRLFEGP